MNHYEHAKKHLGLKEIPGPKHEPRVLEFYKEAGFAGVKDDETAWCAAFANAMLHRAGLAGTKSLAARSFLNYGEPVLEKDVQPGDIVVFWRVSPNSWQGHVAFFVRWAGKNVIVLGGNQSNAVSEAAYRKDTILGIRRPVYPKVVTVAPVLPPKKPDEKKPEDNKTKPDENRKDTVQVSPPVPWWKRLLQ